MNVQFSGSTLFVNDHGPNPSYFALHTFMILKLYRLIYVYKKYSQKLHPKNFDPDKTLRYSGIRIQYWF